MVFIVNIFGILIYLTVLIIAIVIVECRFALKGLQMIYIFFIITSQIMLNIYIDFLGHSLVLGSVNFSMLFLILDLINEKYGRHEANKVVWSGIFVLMLLLFLIFYLSYFASKTDNYFIFFQFFGNQIRYILTDIVISYIIFQFVNIAIFSFLKSILKDSFLSARCILSTVLSQIGTAIFFYELCFFDQMTQNEIFDIIFNGMVIKVLVSLLEIPVLKFLKMRDFCGR